MISVGLDWLRCTFSSSVRSDVRKLAEEFLGAFQDDGGKGRFGYSTMHLHPQTKASVCFSPGVGFDAGLSHAMLDLPGAACSAIPSVDLFVLFKRLIGLGVKWTRLDCPC